MDLASAGGGALLARVAHGLGLPLDQQGEPGAARRLFERNLAIWSDLGNREEQPSELNSLGRLGAARSALGEAITINRELRVPRLSAALTTWASWKAPRAAGTGPSRCWRRRWPSGERQGDLLGVAIDRHSLTLTILRAGLPHQASGRLSAVFSHVASS
jgi:hypothetical protein